MYLLTITLPLFETLQNLDLLVKFTLKIFYLFVKKEWRPLGYEIELKLVTALYIETDIWALKLAAYKIKVKRYMCKNPAELQRLARTNQRWNLIKC